MKNENIENISCERTDEFEQQRRKEVLKGSYIKLEIIIPKENPDMPIVSFLCKNCPNKNIPYMFTSIKSVYQDLSIKFPFEKIYSDLFLSTGKDFGGKK